MENLCQTITKKGTPCGCKARPGFATCGTHKVENEVVILCQCIKKNKEVCSKKATINGMCKRHYQLNKERDEREVALVVWHHCIIDLYTNANVEDARNRIQFAYDTNVITHRWFDLLSGSLEDELTVFYFLHPPPNETPKSELHALALDAQNIHTGAVNMLVSKGLETLLQFEPLPTSNWYMELSSIWESKPKGQTKKVLKDMDKWYTTATCRQANDYLYKRTLDGLWTCIKQSPHKVDLIERLWEETNEAMGLCCEGHIARLCNVMCGFDDAFKPQVSVGELLQQKISAIASKELPTHQKVGEAWIVFEELSIPSGERIAWLEAL
jgi:hypothetical protein